MQNKSELSKSIDKKITSVDVAKHAGVSRSAVSRAFTPGANIAEKTREKVLLSAQQLGYQVNYLARDLKSKHSGFVGILANDITMPFRAEQIHTITKKLLSVGYRPIVLNTSSTQVKNMLGDLLGYRMAGFVIISDTPPSHIVDKCCDFDIPVIFVNRFYQKNNVDRVELDFNACGETIFGMLNPLPDSKMAVVEVEQYSYTLSGCVTGFKNICTRENFSIHSFYAPKQSYQAGLDIAPEIVSYIQKNPLHGLFVATDLLALGVCDGVKQQGVKIPEDLQIVGFDNIEQSGWLSYQLSTVAQDIHFQMQQVVNLLVNRIQYSHTPYMRICQKITPIHRKTTRA